ncbi:uncharacterized protein [Diadema antillarum]|uniref:uncharacterized protein n=1 Tax=Diadema antillarum TaxID=105358 RepID=UPI003A83EC8D
MTPEWTSQDEREHQALYTTYMASARRRWHAQRRREQRQQVVEQRRRLLNWDELESEDSDPDIPQAGQGDNVVMTPWEQSQTLDSQDIYGTQESFPPSSHSPTDNSLNAPSQLDSIVDTQRDLFSEPMESTSAENPDQPSDSQISDRDVSQRDVNAPENLSERIREFYSIQQREEREAPRFRGRIVDYRLRIRPLETLLARYAVHDVGGNVCTTCGIREHIFKGDDTLDKFCEWLFGTEEDHEGVTAIAHNARSYDTQFLQEYCHRQGIVPEVIMNGAKILSLKVNDVKVIDSLSFLAMPLSSFPSTFGLKELKKGFFPHFFNKTENQDYKGALPDKSYYDPDGMSENKRLEFEAWYSVHRNDHFDFEDEILAYCRSDVQILMEGCMAFRTLFMKVTGNIDPFKNITIASACNTVFRTKFLKPNSIGLIPTHGYRWKDRHSLLALKWLEWISHQNDVCINHARNGGEHRIGRFRVDGYDRTTNTIYEFLGDLWHGCPRCYPRRDVVLPGSDETVQDVYDRTMYRLNVIRKQGYTVVTMWECQFRKMMKEDLAVANFVDALQFQEPLQPREAFYGGRTNALKLYHRVQNDERIKYVDVCSLYPWVCKYTEFPLGHPTVITDNFDDIGNYFGLVKCMVCPPRQLFHPVLPYRSEEGKLLFPLCRTCANDKQTTPCDHSDEERALLSTWVSEELKKAVELGYKIVDIYEVWHYPRKTKYNPETKKGGLFSEYIDLFLKVKQESSGWPSECLSETDLLNADILEARKNYIDSYEKKEGVLLDESKIEKNGGLRAVSKICLNSFWGKLGQRNNLTKTEYCENPERFFSILTNPAVEVKTVDFPHENLAQIQYVPEDDFLEVLPNTNVVLAAFTTCHARLKLYTYLEKLQKNVLYTDTDSIIYLKNDDVDDVPTGNFLGDMTDELEKDFGVGSYITELIA